LCVGGINLESLPLSFQSGIGALGLRCLHTYGKLTTGCALLVVPLGKFVACPRQRFTDQKEASSKHLGHPSWWNWSLSLGFLLQVMASCLGAPVNFFHFLCKLPHYMSLSFIQMSHEKDKALVSS